MQIEEDIKLDFSNVLIRPKRSTLKSRKDVDLSRTMKFRNSQQDYTGVPVMAANMDGVGTFEMAEALAELGLFTVLTKSYTSAQIHQWLNQNRHKSTITNHVAVSTGITDEDFKKVNETLKLSRSIKYVCVDVANGYTEMFSEFIYKLRTQYPGLVIIAGNVVTGDMTQELILNGADIVKVGIGPGSVCTTRIQTGVGYPQLSAVIECADAAHGLGGHIIADGGCTCPGDVAKAFGAGADFVMLGGMLAGHDEGGGEVLDGKITFYGMSSETANDKHFGGLKDYRSAEGKEVSIPHKGKVESTVQTILGGLRSTCTYVGASRLKDLTKCTTFVKVYQTHNRVYE